MMNVLKDFSYRPRHYITHPWKFFAQCGRNMRAAWQRITKGYCYRDAWNMDDWFLAVAPPMLRAIADDISYPGNDEFPTWEDWHRYLYHLAAQFEVSQETWQHENNPYDCTKEYEKWSQWINNANKNRMKNLGEALAEFSRMEVFNNLWT